MGYIVGSDGQASEVRIATLHTICSRSVLWMLSDFKIRDYTIEDHRQNRDLYLARAAKNNLVKAFASSVDVHTFGASLVLDKPLPQVTKDDRVGAKTVTLGRQFGRGYKAIAAQYGIDEETMRVRVEAWDNAFPEFTKEWHPSVKRFAHRFKFVSSLFGLVRRLRDIDHEESMWVHKAEREAINSPVQGDSHLWISRANTWFHLNILDPNPHIRAVVWNDVHDEVISDVPDSELDFIVPRQAAAMLHPLFDPWNYPWMVCDLATEVKVQRPWGTKCIEVMFNTAQMPNKFEPGFNLIDACCEIWHREKKARFKDPKPKRFVRRLPNSQVRVLEMTPENLLEQPTPASPQLSLKL